MSSSASSGGERSVTVLRRGSEGLGFQIDKDLLILAVDKDAKSLKKQGLGKGFQIKSVNGHTVLDVQEFHRAIERSSETSIVCPVCSGSRMLLSDPCPLCGDDAADDNLEFEMQLAPLPATIFMNDSANAIKIKVDKYGLSGGGDTRELHRMHGANLERDMPYQYLRHIMNDDVRLEQIGVDYQAGRIETHEVKQICVDELVQLVAGHQQRLTTITDDVVSHFMNPNRPSLRL